MSEMPGDTTHDNAHMTWVEWPESVPRPTQKEWDAAEVRHRRADDNDRARFKAEGLPPYQGDMGYSLSFDMATGAIGMWWHFFFPGGRDANGKQCGWDPSDHHQVPCKGGWSHTHCSCNDPDCKR